MQDQVSGPTGRRRDWQSRGLAALGDIVWGTRGCFFTFHRSAPSEVWPSLPNRNFYLDAGFLDGLLGYLAQAGWAVVTMDEALQRLAADDGGRFVNFSVDDCYRDTADIVAPIFRKHGVPVTLFVTTGIPDGTLALSDAGLEATIAGRDSIVARTVTIPVATATAKRRAFEQISREWDAGDAASRYAEFCVANGVCPISLHSRNAITWDHLRALAQESHIEIGAHTISHRRLSSLSTADAESEIAGSGQRLRDQLGVPCRHFAFPFGRDADCAQRESDITRRSGFASAATTRKGLARAGLDRYRLPRNTLNGTHRSNLLAEAHLSGFTGLAARVIGRV